MGDGKGYIILLSGHPVIIAGMSYRIDAIGKPDINHTLVYKMCIRDREYGRSPRPDCPVLNLYPSAE